MTNRKNNLLAALRDLLPVLLIELALSAVMVGVYAVLGKLSSAVLFGALLGTAAAILNFAVMAASVLRAADAETPEKGKLSATGNYILRMVVLAAVLVLALKSEAFAPIPTLLPLIFFRIAVYLGELLFQKGEKSK